MTETDSHVTQLSSPNQRAPLASPTAHAVKAKPDPRPMRFAFGAAGFAALSALTTAIVLPAQPTVVAPQAYSTETAGTGTAYTAATGTPVALEQPVQYIQLLPGQTAPPGATVIDPDGPKPTAIVVTIPAPAAAAAVAPAPAPAPAKKPAVKTTQSGKVIP